MDNKKEIKSIGRLVSFLYRKGRIYVGKQFEKYGIGQGQYIYMIFLYHKDGVSQDYITKRLNIDKGTTAKALKKLEKEGYIVKKSDTDKRVNNIFLTDKAHNIKKEFFTILRGWSKILSDGFTEEETELVLKLLSRMVENANKIEDLHNG